MVTLVTADHPCHTKMFWMTPTKPVDYMLPTFTDCWGRQSEYLYMKYHLDNSNLVGYRIGGAYRCDPILKA